MYGLRDQTLMLHFQWRNLTCAIIKVESQCGKKNRLNPTIAVDAEMALRAFAFTGLVSKYEFKG